MAGEIESFGSIAYRGIRRMPLVVPKDVFERLLRANFTFLSPLGAVAIRQDQ